MQGAAIHVYKGITYYTGSLWPDVVFGSGQQEIFCNHLCAYEVSETSKD